MKKRSVSEGIAILALLLNILVFPGIGSIVGRRDYEGIWQVVLSLVGGLIFVVGLVFTITIVGAVIGIPLMVLGLVAPIWAWIWGLITGIDIIRHSS